MTLYSSYNEVIITEILVKGAWQIIKKIGRKWKTSEVLWAHYLYGQKIVENR
jgi:hypothetical protein